MTALVHPTRRRASMPVGRRTPRLLAGAWLVVAALFLAWDLQGSLRFALELRAEKLAALTLVGAALGSATVVFHTITGNRILSPSMLGLDALYLTLQFGTAWAVGTNTLLALDGRVRFVANLAVMIGATLILQRVVLRRAGGDAFLLVLVAVVLGGMFQSITALVTRLIDPNEFQSLQDLMFAGFASIDRALLVPAAAGVAGIGVALLRGAPTLDTLALGHDTARGLGLRVDLLLRRGFLAVAALVSIATALVGPILFLGLVAAHLAYRSTGTHRHAVTLPAAAGFGASILVGGQFVLERLLDSGTRLSMIVGFVGGLLVLRLLFTEASR